MASSQLSRRPVRRAVRVWGSARVAEAGITADEERRLRTRGLPEVSGIASLTKSEAKRDTREIEKAAHWLPGGGPRASRPATFRHRRLRAFTFYSGAADSSARAPQSQRCSR